ncbi:hypothetical protein Tco_1116454, partial [Tanacetum coccineum]
MLQDLKHGIEVLHDQLKSILWELATKEKVELTDEDTYRKPRKHKGKGKVIGLHAVKPTSLSRYGYSSVAEGDLRKFSDMGAWDDMVSVQVPRCMVWLDYDEHVDSLSTMDNEVGVTNPQSTTQTLPSFEEYTPPVNYPKEVEKTLGTPIEVEPLNETKLEEAGLNYNHNTPFSSREVPSFDGPELQPLLNREELSLFDRPNEAERGRIIEAHRLESILEQQIPQRMALSHHDH